MKHTFAAAVLAAGLSSSALAQDTAMECDAATNAHAVGNIIDIAENEAPAGSAISMIMSVDFEIQNQNGEMVWVDHELKHILDNMAVADIGAFLNQEFSGQGFSFDETHVEYIPDFGTIFAYACFDEDVTPFEASQQIDQLPGLRAAPNMILESIPVIIEPSGADL